MAGLVPAAPNILSATPGGPRCFPGLVSTPQNLPFPGISKNGRQCLEGMRGGLRGKDQPGEWGGQAHGQGAGLGLLSVLTTNLLFTFSRICFSLSAMASPFRFLMRFFSSFLQAYILPVARTWQAHT